MAINLDRPREHVDAAFALGGYACHNYHGAGFLQAAIELNFKPDLISCTSGQIYWVWNYLLARRHALQDQEHAQGAEDLRQLAKANLANGPRPDDVPPAEFIKDMQMAFFDYLSKFANLPPINRTSLETVGASIQARWVNFWLSIIPAHVLNPAVTDHLCRRIADDFNAVEDIGIVFNSYDPEHGLEFVHINPKAERILNRKPGQFSSFRRGDAQDSPNPHNTQYKSITQQSVKNALWIYEYGFHEEKIIDGSYFRQIMLGELTRAGTIYVARPVNMSWLTVLPTSYGDKETLKTDLFFNSAYHGELFRIKMMNYLINNKRLTEEAIRQHDYHIVEIIEVPISVQRAFASFLGEDMKVFEQACTDSKIKLRK
jgi:hypothetical protein